MRKLLMLVTMLLVPALANAWTFAVKVTNTTAGIAAGNKATATIGATSTDVTANLKYFVPPGSVTVAVTNAPSATISLVGGTLGAPTVSGTTNTYVIPANATKTLQTLNVVYATAATAVKANVSVVQTPGGMTQLQIGGSSTVKGFTAVPVGTSVTVKPAPSTGYSLTSVSLNGAPLAAPYTFTVADATADVVTAFYIKDAVVTATLALAQSGPVGTPVTATITATGATGYTWTVNGVAQASTSNTMTFTPVAGANMVQVTIAGAAIPVVKSASFMGVDMIASTNYTCTSCHSGSTPALVAAYTASGHADASYSPTCEGCHSSQAHTAGITAANVDKATFKILSSSVSVTSHGHTTVLAKGDLFCTGCHNGAYAIPHAVTGLGTTCAGCHSSSGDAHGIKKLNHAFAADPDDTTNCATCHTNTAPHYGGQAFHKAQYVSAASVPVDCTYCHGASVSTTANQAILRQFTSSSHGKTNAEAWVHFDWRNASRAACQRCHAGTAFVAKLGSENSIANVYQSTDVLKPGEVLNCSACHSNAATGAIRSATQQFTINMTNGASVTYEVAGASTLCARCHSGRATGSSITADANITGIRGFIDSHYQPAAGTLYNKAGYEYAGQSYDSLGSHKLLGATSQGPCVTCHMPGKNHNLDAASCDTCHNGVTAPIVNAADKKASYDAALNNLNLALQAKGIYYGSAHPFFYTAPYAAGSTNTAFTNWGSVYGASAWKDTMGAAFNYNLLWSEKGAYAHNYDYAMKLIADSIDFLNDGTVGGP